MSETVAKTDPSVSRTEASVSVRTLAACAFPGGSIQTFSRSRKLEREGQQAHLHVQANRPEHYQSEVSLEYRYDAEDIRLLIRGRMDGLIVNEGTATIEEIKSSRLDFEEI